MRGAFIIGLLVVSLIVGLLVMKNMGADNSSGKTQAKKYVEKAENTANDVNQRLKDINKRVKGANVD